MLFVCRANLCRSAMAERLARAGGLAATSAGTHAVPGLDMPPEAKAVLRELGADPEGFASRRVDGGLLAGADLVLTATRAERAHCVTLAPAVAARTFTLRQFGRYLEASPPGPTALRDVARARGRLQPGSPLDDDLPDPYGGPIDGYRDCAATIARILTLLADRPRRDPG
ncbi:low molecular weight phosphatase family protein [Dactylosporangium aurantiacum]|uniref:Low molecular weight phosphatase family protein n=1 Tax=Dactylosporangium aurantiacum TaxID=35754 RepID=A0A9Q9ILA6_9ACTN|nr:low molecular weight phosphatase family protein [Dactylosporangium aurantiacum]MDG6100831.1 low molecular weight phosphatase family protein [Dactylosporangium aurantiacum]UWZ55108.1 low molecular weight phosphatase family protein [Dactylosporangium aurantiacum]